MRCHDALLQVRRYREGFIRTRPGATREVSQETDLERPTFRQVATRSRLGMPCTFEASAKTEPELMQKIAEHARTVHKIDPIPQDLLAKVKKAIRK